MRFIKISTLILIIIICLSAVSCAGSGNHPGLVKTKYWVSEDESIAFYFPAEAGRGKAQGQMIIGNALKTAILLEWDKNGKVKVTDAGYTFLFSADTVTDKDNLTCTFRITEQSGRLNLEKDIVFRYRQEFPKCLTSEPFMPEQTSLDLWILQDTEPLDLSEYESIPGWFGAEEIYGKGYEQIFVDGEGFTDPDHYVKYLISAWPDYADGGEYITKITITDPAVTFFGLNVESSPEEFDRVLSGKGFLRKKNIDSPDIVTEYKIIWDNGLYYVTLGKSNGKCAVVIDAHVSNRDNIIF